MSRLCTTLALGALLVTGTGTAHAQAPGPEPDLWERDKLTGNWGGLRDTLEKEGITFGLMEQSEGWSGLRGGIRRGGVYTGLTTATLKVDLETIAKIPGLTLNISGYQIHGRGPSPNLSGALQAVSNIEATRGNKLYDLYLEEEFPDTGLNIRIGQSGANEEFMLIKSAAVLINSSFGFPALAAFGLPSGGPNYPLAAPMVRVRYKATEQLTLMGGIYNGDPAGPGTNDPQLRDYTGTSFRMRDGVLGFAEIAYDVGSADVDGRPGTYKIGGWYHSGNFNNLQHDVNGLSLADSAHGAPYRHHGNYAVYGLMDQTIWRPQGSKDRGINLFALVTAAPSDRNFSSFFIEGGVVWVGPCESRDADILSLGVAYTNLSHAQQTFGSDLVRFGSATKAFRGGETVIELTYQAAVTKWLLVQPDVQYIINPGAGVPTVASNGQVLPLKDAVAAGVRATIIF